MQIPSKRSHYSSHQDTVTAARRGLQQEYDSPDDHQQYVSARGDLQSVGSGADPLCTVSCNK